MSVFFAVFSGWTLPGDLWDVEDLVQSCKDSGSQGGCPYYTAHILAGDADIVFCPHNYILDPAVSQCRSHHRERWSLDGRIIMIDEAHNLEQACRDAGSLTVSLSELCQLNVALEKLPLRRSQIRVRVHGRDLPCRDVCAELQRVPQLLAKFLDACASGSRPASSSERSASASQPEPLSGLSCVWGLPDYSPTIEFMAEAGLSGRSLLDHGTEELCVEVNDRLLRLQACGDGDEQDAALIGMLDRLREVLAKLRLAACHSEYYVPDFNLRGLFVLHVYSIFIQICVHIYDC